MAITKLSDLQLVILSTAANRADASLLPLPDSVAGQAARIRKAIPPLLTRALVIEIDVVDPARMWREDGERRIGVAITDAGRSAIGAEQPNDPASATPDQPPQVPGIANAPVAIEPTAPRKKSAEVVAMLQRHEGATLAELVAATGWLPHSTRAALTSLRKKGHAIAKDKRDEVTCYRIATAA